MNLLEELVKKYEGSYSEEAKKSSIFTSGQFNFHPQNGVLELDGTKITVNINAISGAVPTAEPYRIVLYLDQDYKMPLRIFPKSFYKKLWYGIFPQKHSTLPKHLKQRFSFHGDQKVIDSLGKDQKFCRLIQNEKTFIMLGKKFPKCVILTPAHGIDDLNHFEKLLQVLKHIEATIKNIK